MEDITEKEILASLEKEIHGAVQMVAYAKSYSPHSVKFAEGYRDGLKTFRKIINNLRG